MTLKPWSEPFARFGALFEEAKRATPKDPNAMQLATVDASGRPSVRTVLLKEFDERGFVFYTNHGSAKGRALDASKVAALNFYWPGLDQQVRVEGTVAVLEQADADEYFAQRPRFSQLGAWASHQSERLESRAVLEQRLAEVTARFEGHAVPRPDHWGGFRVEPERIEFWRAHEFRLHWREDYVRRGSQWEHGWLNP